MNLLSTVLCNNASNMASHTDARLLQAKKELEDDIKAVEEQIRGLNEQLQRLYNIDEQIIERLHRLFDRLKHVSEALTRQFDAKLKEINRKLESASVNAKEQQSNDIDREQQSNLTITGPYVNPIEYIQAKQRQELQSEVLQEGTKLLKEQMKLIKSELYVLRDVLETIIAKERVLLSERNQMYKLVAETKQKLLQLEKSDIEENTIDEIRAKIEEIRRSRQNIFTEDDDTNKTKLIERDPYTYAKQFTDKVNTLDTSSIVADEDESPLT